MLSCHLIMYEGCRITQQTKTLHIKALGYYYSNDCIRCLGVPNEEARDWKCYFFSDNL